MQVYELIKDLSPIVLKNATPNARCLEAVAHWNTLLWFMIVEKHGGSVEYTIAC
jgi:hypothetical protein